MTTLVDTVDILESLGMIKSGMNVLDIGCFRGYWADTFQALNYDVDYLGLDVSLAHTAFNHARFRGTKFRFKQLDIFNATYNPMGKFHASKVKFPVEDSSVDLVICHSLFTHLGKFENSRRYMNEIIRIMKPGGFLWVTFFTSPPNVQDAQSYRTVRTVNTEAEVHEIISPFTKLYERIAKTMDYNDQTMYGLQK